MGSFNLIFMNNLDKMRSEIAAKIAKILSEYPSHPPMSGSEQGINEVAVNKLVDLISELLKESENDPNGFYDEGFEDGKMVASELLKEREGLEVTGFKDCGIPKIGTDKNAPTLMPKFNDKQEEWGWTKEFQDKFGTMFIDSTPWSIMRGKMEQYIAKLLVKERSKDRDTLIEKMDIKKESYMNDERLDLEETHGAMAACEDVKQIILEVMK
jgi:hypothetical protein